MITIKEEKENKKKKVEPHYIVKYEYIIGDSDGYTSEKVNVSLKNPYVERYVKLLNSLEPVEDKWGVMLDETDLIDHLNAKQISEDDYNFLLRMMFEESESKFEVSEENQKYANEFFDGVYSDTEYSFLVFEKIKLFYVDEFGKKHKTEVK